MSSISFPGPEFPAYPILTVDRPDGWSPIPTAGYVLALGLDGTGPDEYQPNVVCSVTRLPRQADLADAIDHVVSSLTATTDFAEVEREEAEIAGRPGFRMAATYTHPRGGSVSQAVQLAWCEHDGVTDLIQTIGACTTEQVDEVGDVIREIQDSLSIG